MDMLGASAWIVDTDTANSQTRDTVSARASRQSRKINSQQRQEAARLRAIVVDVAGKHANIFAGFA